MRKTATITAGLLLGASLLAGCGGDGEDKKGNALSGKSYCEVLKSTKSSVESFSGTTAPSQKQFDEFLENIDNLADKAPDAVADDWKVVADGMDTFADALEDIGVSLEEFAEAMSSGKLPEGVTTADLTTLGQKLEGLADEKFTEASTAIDKHAKDECKVDLSLAG